MKKNILKRMLAVCCVAALLITQPGMTVHADETQGDEAVIDVSLVIFMKLLPFSKCTWEASSAPLFSYSREMKKSVHRNKGKTVTHIRD